VRLFAKKRGPREGRQLFVLTNHQDVAMLSEEIAKLVARAYTTNLEEYQEAYGDGAIPKHVHIVTISVEEARK
jgi:hypothetical protein